MHKTSTINLSCQLFNIDEDAYRLLKTYLDRLREQLKNDDDRDEIMQDFEQAIAEHFMDALPSKDKAVTVALVNRVTKTSATMSRPRPLSLRKKPTTMAGVSTSGGRYT